MTGTLQPSGFFVLRTPLLSFDEFLAWTDGPDREARLLEMVRRPEVADALYVASPSLADALADPASPRARKALPSLASYFGRMCSRAVPFGLFAGISVGDVTSSTCLDVGDVRACARSSRLDMGYLALLVAALEQEPAVRSILTWSPNSSLYPAGNRMHIAAMQLGEAWRSYHLVAVDGTKALRATLDRAAEGATVDDLAAHLESNGVNRKEAEEYVVKLIDAQLLVSDLQPAVTGEDPLTALISAWGGHPEMSTVVARLEDVRALLAATDAGGPGAAPAAYREVQALLDALPVRTDAARLVQVDMRRPAPPPTLGSGPLAEMARAVEILRRLSLPASDDDPLTQFRDAFVDRYGDRDVPLFEAIDPEVGIGFGPTSGHDRPPLIEGLALFPASDRAPRWRDRDAFLLRKLAAALEAGEREIRIEAADLDALESPEPVVLPDAVEVVAVLAAASREAVDQGRFQVFVRGVLGPPGASLLGRFCHADDDLLHKVRSHLRAEEACRPDAVFAEVVHLPQGRIGNIVCRPLLRAWEIPYLGRSGAEAAWQLPVADLTVSVVAGRVVLSSMRLGREVVPRLTTAHDYVRGALPIYHFLCALQEQGVAGQLGWDWGPLADAPFLPRVTCGRLVFARAQWHLSAKELEDVPGLRSSGRLPRFVALAHGDSDLAIDLDNPLCIEVLRRHASGRPSTTLMELFPGPDDMCSAGPGGRFTHDLVVPFVQTPPQSPRPARRAGARPTIRRSFPPGSEWFSAKLYTGAANADLVLLELVRPLVDEAMRRGIADSWFFVRFSDPDWHLRVRLHGDAAASLALLNQLNAPLLKNRTIWRVQLDTYEREIERYGGDPGMALSERLFQHDSEAALALIQQLKGDAAQQARWQLAVLGVDMILTDLGFGLADKESWARDRRHAYAEEFRAGGRLRGQLGDLYRSQRKPLSDLLERDDEGSGHPLGPAVEVLRRRSEHLRLLGVSMAGRGLDLPDLAASYAHMHVNRLLRSAHRAQELVIYDLLHRFYVSRIEMSRRA